VVGEVFRDVDVVLTPTAVDGIEVMTRGHLGVFTQPLSFVGPAGDLGARRRRGAVAAGVPLVAAPFMEARLFRIAARLEADGVVAAPVASARS